MQEALEREEIDFIFDLYRHKQISDSQVKQEHEMKADNQATRSLKQAKDPSYLT